MADAAAQLEQLQADVAGLRQQIQQRRANQRISKFANDGTETWLMWKNHFTNTARLNGFTDLETRLALKGAMAGNAALITMDIDPDANINGNAPTAEAMLNLFQAKFLPAAASQIAINKFQQARQGTTESLLAFHGRLRAIHGEAYPNAVDQTNLIERFTQGIRRDVIRAAVYRAKVQNYDDALTAAQDETAVMQLTKITTLGAAPMGDAEPMEIGAMQPTGRSAPPKTQNGGNSDTCHFCQKKGHWKKDCNLLKRAKKAQGKAKGKKTDGSARVTMIAALTKALQEEEMEVGPTEADPNNAEETAQDF